MPNLDPDARLFAQDELPELLPRERDFVLSVCRFETSFGQGWVVLAGKLGMPNPGQFANVNNWGAVTSARQGPPPASLSFALEPDRFFMRDRWWRNYGPGKAGAAAGLKDAARIILKPNVKAALAQHDGTGAVFAMKANGYFQEDPTAYAANVARNYQAIVAAGGGGDRLSFASSPSSSSSSSGGTLVLLGLAWFALKGTK